MVAEFGDFRRRGPTLSRFAEGQSYPSFVNVNRHRIEFRSYIDLERRKTTLEQRSDRDQLGQLFGEEIDGADDGKRLIACRAWQALRDVDQAGECLGPVRPRRA